MKKSLYFIASLFGALAFTACSEMDYRGLDENDIMEAADVIVTAEVNQETNVVTLTMKGKSGQAIYPVWELPGTKGVVYSTTNGLGKIFVNAGDYTIPYRVGNANGVSMDQGSVTFHVDNTLVNFDKYYTLLCDRQWRMDRSKDAHMACGEPGTDGTNWWSAKPDEKKDFGVYANFISFTKENLYTFDPGESGTMYVNTGCSIYPEYHQDADFCVPVQFMESAYEISVEGNDVFLTLDPESNFPYIANDDQWANPRFRLEELSGKQMVLVYDNGAIAWHFIFTSVADDTPQEFTGFKYSSEFNLWKAIDDGDAFTTNFWYAPDWNQIADPGFAKNGSAYTFTLPQATSLQWQAQCFVVPNELLLQADKKYDVSMVISSTTDIANITLKLTDKTDDGNFLFTENVAVKAYEDKVFYLSDINGLSKDADCKMVFDFGGNPANTEVTIKNIVIKDHANDDGTVLPSTEEPDVPVVDWNKNNLWETGNPQHYFSYYAPGWSQIDDPAVTVDGGNINISLPAGTYERWQAQVAFSTSIQTEASKQYHFHVKMNPNNDLRGVTVKLVHETDDGIFLTEGQHDLKAYEDNVIELFNMAGKDINALRLFFDFGGNPDGTEVAISEISLVEAEANAGGGGDWSGTNLWASGNPEHYFSYYAPGWSQIADPDVTVDDGNITIKLPSATYEQWQAQVAFRTNINISPDKKYAFRATLTPNVNLRGVTVKLVHQTDDGIFLTAAQHDLAAYEDNIVEERGMSCDAIEGMRLFFDFGGNPDGTEVTISDIVLIEE